MIRSALAALRVIYAPMKLQPLQKKVTIISRQSDEPSDDIRLLQNYLQAAHPDLRLQVLCRSMERTGPLKYAFHMLRQMGSIASSAVVLLDGYCIAASVLDHRKQTVIIQMWHALAAVKQFGYQAVGRPSGRSEEIARLMKMHRNYDQVLAAGRRTGEFFCRAFNAGPEKIRLLGLPRIDLILQEDDSGEKLRQEFAIPDDREIILYVPTFRKDQAIPAEDLIRGIDPDRFVLVVKLHPLWRELGGGFASPGENGGLRIIVDEKYTSYDWLHACDRIVTDYSALGLEAALTGKPVYWYLYDLEEYKRAVGLNIDPMEEIPEASAADGAALGELLARPYDYGALNRFRDTYIDIETEGCTEKLGEHIYGIAEKIYQEISEASR